MVKVAEEKYVVAEALFETVADILGWENVEIIKNVPGSELEHIVAVHPFYDRDSPCHFR